MKLLLLGGTAFLGRHLTEAALQRGYEVTLFTRGKSNPDLYPQAEKITGDRDGGLEGLRGRKWDAVIDTSGYVPRVVKESAELLACQVERYVFVSSVSAYADLSLPGVAEGAPLQHLDEVGSEDVGKHYGALKALCEQEVLAAFPGDALIIRPGLIVGPYDPTDRFTYWPRRIRKGGEFLAPGRPDAPVQFIDARDLAEWMLDLTAQQKTGVYNAVGPEQPLTMRTFLETAREELNPDAPLAWVEDEAFLLEKGLGPWQEMPLWIPAEEITADALGMQAVNGEKARSDGLVFRPLAETLRDTLNWDLSRPVGTPRKAGLSEVKEAELLMAWRRSANV
ncbi:NAD-dependent epimerase/dehydratase family protein [Gorillibacterium massiliense]|uniref:NAD-dependent epimerase/dehydratase family protein n=1 Tax=Gorillibacterium massiliense TaxID=1280390 RepID=UPI0004BC334F|nr:NAD-dependent epimerase/dehydratase family protein [Gorillibacterium massiliense]